jgi:hypothetical protein
MTGHVKGGKGVKLMPPGQQCGHGTRNIRQVCPLVPHSAITRQGKRRDRFAGLYHPLGKPVVARVRAKEIAGPDNNGARPTTAGGLKPAFQFDTDGALAGERTLRRIFPISGNASGP